MEVTTKESLEVFPEVFCKEETRLDKLWGSLCGIFEEETWFFTLWGSLREEETRLDKLWGSRLGIFEEEIRLDKLWGSRFEEETRLDKLWGSRLGIFEEETRLDKLWGSRLGIFGVPEAKNGDYKSAISAKGQPRRISGLYSVNRRQRGNSTHFRMEHSALNGSKSKWKMEVKFRPKGNDVAKWQNISVYYPGATTEIDHNFINLTIPWPEEEHEFAVFGTPEKEDKKRMQLGIFGENRAKGKKALFHAVFFDDTLMAFKNVCSKEESEGRHLLTTLGGLFVSISDEDIKIEVSGLESGFEWKGSSVKTIKSKDAWNTPENSTDFPYCVFEIKCVDKMKQSFLCEITATHEKDSTKVLVVTPLEQKNEVPFAG